MGIVVVAEIVTGQESRCGRNPKWLKLTNLVIGAKKSTNIRYQEKRLLARSRQKINNTQKNQQTPKPTNCQKINNGQIQPYDQKIHLCSRPEINKIVHPKKTPSHGFDEVATRANFFAKKNARKGLKSPLNPLD